MAAHPHSPAAANHHNSLITAIASDVGVIYSRPKYICKIASHAYTAKYFIPNQNWKFALLAPLAASLVKTLSQRRFIARKSWRR